MKNVKKLAGEKVFLSPMTKKNLEQYVEWLNDLEIMKNLIISMNMNEVNEGLWLENTLKNGEPVFGIVDTESEQLIGNCGLHNVDHINGLAEFGIVIGDKAFWGKGYGTEATELILDYGFNVLNLHNIMLRVYDFNGRGISCYKKTGFKEFGRRRSAVKMAGKRYDVIYMEILAEEFESPYVKKIIQS